MIQPNKISKKNTAPQIPEDTIHLHCVQWLCTQHGHKDIYINHSSNENPRGDKLQMMKYNAKMKKLGRTTGHPDLEILHNGKILYIEFKSQKGKLSEYQKLAHEKIRNAGSEVHIVRSLDEFVQIVNCFIVV